MENEIEKIMDGLNGRIKDASVKLRDGKINQAYFDDLIAVAVNDSKVDILNAIWVNSKLAMMASIFWKAIFGK